MDGDYPLGAMATCKLCPKGAVPSPRSEDPAVRRCGRPSREHDADSLSSTSGTPTDSEAYGVSFPFRQKSARGQPRPQTSIERCCRGCGASFIGLAPGKTGEAGIWHDLALVLLG